MKASIGSTSPGIMAEMDAGVSELHLAVCRRFGDVVRSADGKMTCCYCGPRLKPERPCDTAQHEWVARGPVRRPRAWLAGSPRQDPPTGRHGDEEDQIRSVATATRISCQ